LGDLEDQEADDNVMDGFQQGDNGEGGDSDNSNSSNSRNGSSPRPLPAPRRLQHAPRRLQHAPQQLRELRSTRLVVDSQGSSSTPSQAPLVDPQVPSAPARKKTALNKGLPPKTPKRLRKRGIRAFAGLDREGDRSKFPLTIQHLVATLYTDLPSRLVH
jgi:hypothetical protein